MVTGAVGFTTTGKSNAEDVWIPTTCECCNRGPDLLRFHVVDGVVVGVEGNTDGEGFSCLSRNRGRACPKPYGLIQKLYNPHRLRGPLRRTNPLKGKGIDPGWVEIGWDEALDIIGDKLRKIRATDTRKLAVGAGGAQTARTMNGTWKEFFKVFGPVENLAGGVSLRCDQAEHIFGNLIHGAWHCEPDLTYCNYVIVFGRNPAASGGVAENINYLEGRARGMKIVVVDPVLSPTAAKADEWLPIRPGTDTAFLLALIHVIIHETGGYDTRFLKQMTNSPYLVGPDGNFLRRAGKALVWDQGEAKACDDPAVQDPALEGKYAVDGTEARPAFQVLKDHVRQYTPEWASGITDIPAATLRRIAREWVENARIGSTIEIDGVDLPYRPVATKVGRGITGAMRSYQMVLANHILAALVGAVEVVGGHGGGYKTPLGNERGIVPGEDGMLKMEAYPFTWPPVSRGWSETLAPYTKQYGTLNHLAYLNMAQPDEHFPLPAFPEVYLRFHCNPLISVGQPDIVYEGLKKIPFVVSIAYVMDEVSELADMILPDHTDLERFDLATGHNKANAKKFSAVILRQPVVAPLYDTRDISDILTGLADRIGMIREYNAAINDGRQLVGPHRLEPDKTYAWTEIVDRQCRSVTAGAHDLEWFKEHGAILMEVKAGEQYEVHLEMARRKLRYPLPYLEHVKKTGEELARNLAEVGVNWWPTAEYLALPTYFPPVLENVPPEYDLYVTTTRLIEFGWGSNVDLPWISELAAQADGHQDILMNAKTAASRGIKQGDLVWLESPAGKVKGKVRLTRGIRPDTVLLAGQFGQWQTPVARESGRVSEAWLTPISPAWTDPVIGCMQGNLVKAKLYKA